MDEDEEEDEDHDEWHDDHITEVHWGGGPRHTGGQQVVAHGHQMHLLDMARGGGAMASVGNLFAGLRRQVEGRGNRAITYRWV